MPQGWKEVGIYNFYLLYISYTYEPGIGFFT